MPRDTSYAMEKLYAHGVRRGLHAEQATALVGALHTRYGARFMALYGDDNVSEQTLNEALDIASGVTGISLPAVSEPIETQGDMNG